MAFCSQCGGQLADAAKFCSSCGQKMSTSSGSDQQDDDFPDLSNFGEHPVTFGEYPSKSKVKEIAKHGVKWIEHHLPDALNERISAIPIKGLSPEDQERIEEFSHIEESCINSPKKDKYLKAPLVAFTDYYPTGVLGQFRLANKGKGISQHQDQKHTWGHTDWLFFLENQIVLINDFAAGSWKDPNLFKSFKYEEVQQVVFSDDHMAESGFMNAINYFYTTFQFRLNKDAKYARYLLLGQDENERNNNAYKDQLFFWFLAWKLRLDKNPNTLIAIKGSSWDNTIKFTGAFGVFKEIGD